MTQELFNPRGAFRHEEHPIAPRLPGLDGKILGLVDNGKDNANLFLDHVQEILGKKYKIVKFPRIIKYEGSAAAPFTQEFFDDCDLVINAFGD